MGKSLEIREIIDRFFIIKLRLSVWFWGFVSSINFSVFLHVAIMYLNFPAHFVAKEFLVILAIVDGLIVVARVFIVVS